MPLPHGAYAPIPTPVGDYGLLDPTALDRHLARLARGGLDGALVMGTNGEFPSFDVGERLACADAVARCRSGLELMLGVGSCALPEVLQLLAAAEHLGYGSALLPPPFYFRGAPAIGLIDFFRRALDAAELPVLLYHIPQVTGIPISEEILDGLAGHPRFGGVKDSSGDPAELERFLGRLDGRAYMVGTDRLVAASVGRGGGSISAAASVAPELVVAVHRDPARQPELERLRSLLERHGLGPAVKAILRSEGIGAYRTRPPLIDLDDESAARLLRELEELTRG